MDRKWKKGVFFGTNKEWITCTRSFGESSTNTSLILLLTDYFLHYHSYLIIIKPVQGSRSQRIPTSSLNLLKWVWFPTRRQLAHMRKWRLPRQTRLKCHIGLLRLKVRVLSAGRSLGPRQSLPPRCLSCLCPCHSLIQLSCNNNKSEVYRLFRVEGKEGGLEGTWE